MLDRADEGLPLEQGPQVVQLLVLDQVVHSAQVPHVQTVRVERLRERLAVRRHALHCLQVSHQLRDRLVDDELSQVLDEQLVLGDVLVLTGRELDVLLEDVGVVHVLGCFLEVALELPELLEVLLGPLGLRLLLLLVRETLQLQLLLQLLVDVAHLGLGVFDVASALEEEKQLGPQKARVVIL